MKDDPEFWKNHVSYANERGVKSNESLATLGDAVIGLIIVEYLYNQKLSKKEISSRKSEVVSNKNFAEIARKIKLDKVIRLGKGTEEQAGRKNDGILAQLFEAFIGFKYLSEGLDSLKDSIINILLEQKDNDYFLNFD